MSQSLVLILTPPPHVVLQSDHVVQSVQFPGTVKQIVKKIRYIDLTAVMLSVSNILVMRERCMWVSLIGFISNTFLNLSKMRTPHTDFSLHVLPPFLSDSNCNTYTDCYN